MLYEFTVRLDRAPTGDDDFDRLYEAGLNDSTPETGNGLGLLHVARDSASMEEAITSVVRDLEAAGFHATGFEVEDLIGVAAIGERTGRTRESVRLLASGQRGPGGFPAPIVSGTRPLYSWGAVRAWFEHHIGQDSVTQADADIDTLVAADLLIRARLAAPAKIPLLAHSLLAI